MEFLSDPQVWIAFGTLTLLELVLGIDNVIFISILAGKLPPDQRAKARYIGLALALGTVITSAVIVEGLFGLPGIGTALNLAIRANDFPVIYGIVIFITIAIAALMTILEFVYPLLDPRIRANQ